MKDLATWFYVLEDRCGLDFVPVARSHSQFGAEEQKRAFRRRYRRRAFLVVDLAEDLELHPECLRG